MTDTLSAPSISFTPPLPVAEIGFGKKAICYGIGDEHVVKAERAVFDTSQEAIEHAEVQQGEYRALVGSCLGDYVAPSMFVVEDRPEGYSVSCIQRRATGVSISDAIKLARGDKGRTDIEPVMDFLSKTVALYHERVVVPDLSARPSFVGWFRPTKTPNVIVANNDGLLTPTLIDVGYITGSRLEMATHPRVLRDAIAMKLLMMSFEFRDHVSEQAVYNAHEVIALTPVGY